MEGVVESRPKDSCSNNWSTSWVPLVESASLSLTASSALLPLQPLLLLNLAKFHVGGITHRLLSIFEIVTHLMDIIDELLRCAQLSVSSLQRRVRSRSRPPFSCLVFLQLDLMPIVAYLAICRNLRLLVVHNDWPPWRRFSHNNGKVMLDSLTAWHR